MFCLTQNTKCRIYNWTSCFLLFCLQTFPLVGLSVSWLTLKQNWCSCSSGWHIKRTRGTQVCFYQRTWCRSDPGRDGGSLGRRRRVWAPLGPRSRKSKSQLTSDLCLVPLLLLSHVALAAFTKTVWLVLSAWLSSCTSLLVPVPKWLWQ